MAKKAARKTTKKAAAVKRTKSSEKPSPPSIDPDFRENPSRAIEVFGEINDDLVMRLTPQIRKLRYDEPTSPITVYIDSPGGSVNSYERLEGLLFHPDQSGDRCRIITVVTAMAASAAARLLTRGDYSLAYKNATVHCHGVRTNTPILTRERAESLTKYLGEFNEEMAQSFQNKIIKNLGWLYRFNESEFKGTPPNHTAPTAIQWLFSLMEEKISAQYQLLSDVERELSRVSELEKFIYSNKTRSSQLEKAEQKGAGHRDCALLKLIIDFLEKNFSNSEKLHGISHSRRNELLALFSLRRTYYQRFFSDCDDPTALMQMYASEEHFSKVIKLKSKNEQKDFLMQHYGKILFSSWQLSTTIASRLVKGENPLTAEDAYWLGLVEEVVGVTHLPNIRKVIEYGG